MAERRKPTGNLDNLYAEKKLEPMIVVMPNGRAIRMTGQQGIYALIRYRDLQILRKTS